MIGAPYLEWQISRVGPYGETEFPIGFIERADGTRYAVSDVEASAVPCAPGDPGIRILVSAHDVGRALPDLLRLIANTLAGQFAPDRPPAPPPVGDVDVPF